MTSAGVREAASPQGPQGSTASRAASGALRVRPSLFSLAAVALLSACGGSGEDDTGIGGGGGGSGVLGSFFVASFDAFETAAATLRDTSARYLIQKNEWWFDPAGPHYQSYPLAASRVEYAHAAGLTGRGQTISVVDAGFRTTHEALARAGNSSTGTIPVDDHGTHVASIAAGSSGKMIGVAPKATLHFGSYDTTATLAAATRRANELGAVAQNNSWGFTDFNDKALPATTASFNGIFAGAAGASYLSALTDFAARGVVLFAVSNDSSLTYSGIMDGLPVLRPGLEAGWLAVGNAVATFDNDRILSATRLSSACNEAARWCLFADGATVGASAASNTSYDFATGASFATPQVAGALALLAEAFPDLTPHDLRIRLLASADNGFFTPDATMEMVPGSGYFHGYSTEFGHGFLDIRAALLPIGTPVIATAGGGTRAVDRPLAIAGAAMGDALASSLSAVDVAVTDSLAGRFSLPGDALVSSFRPEPLSARALARAAAADLAGERRSPAAAGGGALDEFQGRTLDLRSAEGDLAASILLPQGAPSGAYGLRLAHGFGDTAARVEIGVTVARDGGAVLGFGAGRGAPASTMVALDLGLSGRFGEGGFLSVGGEFGLADIGTPDAMSAVSAAGFNSMRIEIGQEGPRGDRLSLGLGLPMAVASGSARMTLPVTLSAAGATAAGGPTPAGLAAATPASLMPVSLDLSPDARQVDLSLTYRAPLGEGAEAMFQILRAENYGNIAGRTEAAAVAAVTWRF